MQRPSWLKPCQLWKKLDWPSMISTRMTSLKSGEQHTIACGCSNCMFVNMIQVVGMYVHVGEMLVCGS